MENKLTLAFTTSCRLECFVKTLQSLIKNITDLKLINEIIVSDDNSTLKDLQTIENLIKYYFCNIPYTINHHNFKNHAKNLIFLFSLINDKYLFLCEDDWLFLHKNNYITKCLDILKENENISQVILTNSNWFKETKLDKSKTKLKTTPNNNFYYEWVYKNNANITAFDTWPYFTLTPSIINIEKIKNKNLQFKDEPKFEYSFCKRYVESGLKSVLLPFESCQHIGEISAYTINNSPGHI